MTVIYEKKDHIAYVRLNRPEAKNALDPETVVALAETWLDFRDDDDLRVAIVTGTGDAFCAGADLGKLIPLITGARQPETDADKALQADPALPQRALLREFELWKPVIAAVNGYAIAGGCELVQATDIRVASETASFGLQEVKWAIFPMGGSTVRLPRQIPQARAMETLLTGDRFDAKTALELGFVNHVVPPDQLMSKAEEIARKIAANGPLAVKAIKQAVIENSGLSLKDGLAHELEQAMPVFMSRDAREGPRAFKEKRPPKYEGR
jgi:enoyl-CoA hydratase